MSSLQDRVLVSLNALDNIGELFFNDDVHNEDIYQCFLRENFAPKDVPNWNFTGTWQYIRGEYSYGTVDKVYSYADQGETIYIMFFGAWTSYDEDDYEGFKFVEPKEVTTTIWNPK